MKKEEMGESKKAESKEEERETKNSAARKKKRSAHGEYKEVKEAKGPINKGEDAGKGVQEKKRKRVQVAQSPLKKHSAAFNTPTAFRKMAQRINAKGLPKVDTRKRTALRAGLDIYEKQKRHG